jgi:hypothetical protein
MPIDTLPSLPPIETPALVAQANATKPQFDRVIAICHLAQNPPIPPNTAVNGLSTVFAVKDYLVKHEHRKIKEPISSKILQQPEHAFLQDEGAGEYSYVPNDPNYLGKDQAEVLVEISGLRIKVKYFFRVLDSLPTDADEQKYCPRYKWRISWVSHPKLDSWPMTKYSNEPMWPNPALQGTLRLSAARP